MTWLKRNLYLVVGGVIALGLLGFAGYFLLTKIQKNREVTELLDAQTAELTRLVSRDPHPGTEQVDNIAAAKREAEKLQAFLAEVKKFFPPTLSTNQIADRDFRTLLDRTIHDLQSGAELAGVELPSKDYYFTFAAQRPMMTFPANVIPPLTAQLMEIKSLCDVLYEAKVIALQNLKRSSVATEDTGYTDYMTNKPVTNNYAIATPYELTFHGFSAELAAVLEGLIKSPTCFVVKRITVGYADSAPMLQDQLTTPMPYGPGSYGMNPYANPSMAARYGISVPPSMSRYGGMDPSLASRYGIAPQPMVAPRPANKSGVSPLLEEKLLRVTLTIDAVKLKPNPAN